MEEKRKFDIIKNSLDEIIKILIKALQASGLACLIGILICFSILLCRFFLLII